MKRRRLVGGSGHVVGRAAARDDDDALSLGARRAQGFPAVQPDERERQALAAALVDRSSVALARPALAGTTAIAGRPDDGNAARVPHGPLDGVAPVGMIGTFGRLVNSGHGVIVPGCTRFSLHADGGRATRYLDTSLRGRPVCAAEAPSMRESGRPVGAPMAATSMSRGAAPAGPGRLRACGGFGGPVEAPHPEECSW